MARPQTIEDTSASKQLLYYRRNRERIKKRQREYQRKKYHEDPVHRDKVKKQNRRRPDRYKGEEAKKLLLLKEAKKRAKRKRLTFDLCVDDIRIPSTCPLLGIPIVLDAEGVHVAGSPSLDRIDNAKGYVPGNVHVISFRANSLKADATIDELARLVRGLKERLTQ